jgi:hypothetical protein
VGAAGCDAPLLSSLLVIDWPFVNMMITCSCKVWVSIFYFYIITSCSLVLTMVDVLIFFSNTK